MRALRIRPPSTSCSGHLQFNFKASFSITHLPELRRDICLDDAPGYARRTRRSWLPQQAQLFGEVAARHVGGVALERPEDRSGCRSDFLLKVSGESPRPASSQTPASVCLKFGRVLGEDGRVSCENCRIRPALHRHWFGLSRLRRSQAKHGRTVAVSCLDLADAGELVPKLLRNWPQIGPCQPDVDHIRLGADHWRPRPAQVGSKI